jgi:malate dehydrogenase
VIGSHGESMVPLPRFTMVEGEPLTVRIKDPQRISALVQKTVQRGKEIVSLLGSGSAYFAPAAAITQLVKAVVRNERLPLGVSTFLNGEYGLRDICIGVPAIIGAEGVENIVELKLDIEEKSALVRSAESVKELTDILKKRPASV